MKSPVIYQSVLNPSMCRLLSWLEPVNTLLYWTCKPRHTHVLYQFTHSLSTCQCSAINSSMTKIWVLFLHSFSRTFQKHPLQCYWRQQHSTQADGPGVMALQGAPLQALPARTATILHVVHIWSCCCWPGTHPLPLNI